jgi:hypothetical protein
MCTKYSQVVVLSFLLIFSAAACGKSPTTADPPNNNNNNNNVQLQPALQITCSPTSGVKGTEVTVTIAIKENDKEIGVFGMELTFPPKMLTYGTTSSGSLTGSWAAVDGNEVSAGNLKIGGFRGSGSAVARNSQGSLLVIKFTVDGSELSNGQQGQICIKGYTDDIVGIPPEPACASFTLTK